MTMNIDINIIRLPHLGDLPLPSYATLGSAGMDLFAAIEDKIVINSMERILIPTGISIAVPNGYEAQVRSRSGFAYKHGLVVLNSPGTIDADYRGEIGVIMQNMCKNAHTILRGERIAQMVIAKYESVSWNIVDKLDDTERGSGGLGSTGRQ